jgi:hypothetical protein
VAIANSTIAEPARPGSLGWTWNIIPCVACEILANIARLEKLLDDRPRQVAKVSGLNRNLRLAKRNENPLCSNPPSLFLLTTNRREKVRRKNIRQRED